MQKINRIQSFQVAFAGLLYTLKTQRNAQIHLMIFDGFAFARVIKGWSVLFPSFEIVPVLDLPTLLICGSLSLVPYIAANLVPSWKASVTDPDSVLRS